VTAELEALRAENEALRAKLAAVRRIPELPAEHKGVPIEWRRWEPAPFILCERAGDLNGCPQCDHPGPSLLTFGLAGPGKPLIRFNAHRCPSCEETCVYERRYDKYRIGAELVEIAYWAPKATAQP